MINIAEISPCALANRHGLVASGPERGAKRLGPVPDRLRGAHCNELKMGGGVPKINGDILRSSRRRIIAFLGLC